MSMNRRYFSSTYSGQRGVTLIYTLLISIVMIAAIIGVASISVRESQIQGIVDESIQAQYVAEAGLEYMLSHVRRTEDFSQITMEGDLGLDSTGLAWSGEIARGPQYDEDGNLPLIIGREQVIELYPQNQKGTFVSEIERIPDSFTVIGFSPNDSGLVVSDPDLPVLEVTTVYWPDAITGAGAIETDTPDEDILSYGDLPTDNVNISKEVYTVAELASLVDPVEIPFNQTQLDVKVRLRAMNASYSLLLEPVGGVGVVDAALGPEIVITSFGSFRRTNVGFQVSTTPPHLAPTSPAFDFVLFSGGDISKN
jgi:hypothetical protein